MTDEFTHAHEKTPPSQSNPALKSLEGLVGDWAMELSNTSFLPHSSDTAKGSISFILQERLRLHPSDENAKELLGQCLFKSNHYLEATQAWLTLEEKTERELYNIGIAFLCAKEWDQAVFYFTASLELEQTAQTYNALVDAVVYSTLWRVSFQGSPHQLPSW